MVIRVLAHFSAPGQTPLYFGHSKFTLLPVCSQGVASAQLSSITDPMFSQNIGVALTVHTTIPYGTPHQPLVLLKSSKCRLLRCKRGVKPPRYYWLYDCPKSCSGLLLAIFGPTRPGFLLAVYRPITASAPPGWTRQGGNSGTRCLRVQRLWCRTYVVRPHLEWATASERTGSFTV